MEAHLTDAARARVSQALDGFEIELPSWGFAQTGTRFGKYLDPSAAGTAREKLADAGQVHAVTGCCPTVAVHVLWDFSEDLSDVEDVAALAGEFGVRLGSINPNLFQDQFYKFGSITSADAAVRRQATRHLVESVEIAQRVGSRDISVWLADGSNYPGSAHIRRRRAYMVDALRETHAAMSWGQRLLIEYKPFEPAFYHTDLGDWGMALITAQEVGDQAAVLVDTGHHYQGQNIEQIVAWLLDVGRLGGFHFNDRRYADDDLTLGSIDPYQIFRIFHEINSFAADQGERADIAFMIDQSHNVKTKIEAMVQTVVTAQMLYAKAALVDHEALKSLQEQNRVIDCEELLKAAFFTDVALLLREWRLSRGLPEDPLRAIRESGYLQEIVRAREERNRAGAGSYA